jgi:hypothetical protein
MSEYVISRFWVDHHYEFCAHVHFTIGIHIETQAGSEVAGCRAADLWIVEDVAAADSAGFMDSTPLPW